MAMDKKNVEMFKYPVPGTDEVEAEIKARNIVGNKCYHALGYFLKKRHITQQLRVGLSINQ
jgi:hypothetical protein